MNSGDAVIYQPFGGVEVGTMHLEKGLLWADIDVSAARSSRRKFDVSDHYSRPDVFMLSVDRSRKEPVSFNLLDSQSADEALGL